MEIKIREECFILSPIRKGSSEACSLITSVCIKRRMHIQEEVFIKGTWGREVSSGWRTVQAHEEFSCTYLGNLMTSTLVEEPKEQLIIMHFNATRETWVRGFGSQCQQLPLQAIGTYHVVGLPGKQNKNKSWRPGSRTCCSWTILLAEKGSAS